MTISQRRHGRSPFRVCRWPSSKLNQLEKCRVPSMNKSRPPTTWTWVSVRARSCPSKRRPSSAPVANSKTRLCSRWSATMRIKVPIISPCLNRGRPAAKTQHWTASCSASTLSMWRSTRSTICCRCWRKSGKLRMSRSTKLNSRSVAVPCLIQRYRIEC